MKKIISAVLAVILCVCCFSVGIIEIGKDVAEKIEFKQVDKLFSEVTSLDGEIENRVVVTCKKELDPRGAVQTASGYDNIQVFQYETKEQAQNALDYYSSLSYVENAEFDRVLTPASDQLLDNYDAKCFATASQGIDDMIKLINENYTDLPEIKVAVIDSGCEENEITSGRVENLGNTSGDDCIHGTKVCGTIVYNTLPNVKVYSYDVGDTNGFSSISAITAMSKARLQGCKIINMSYGAYETSTSEKNAVNSCYNAGMIMVAASGNDGKELTSDVTHYPSGYSSVFSIGGLTIGRGKASFTNYGVGVDFYAVGTSVRTFYDGADAYWSGTSAATPVVVSVVANLLTADSSLTFSQIKSAIVTKTSYDDVENCPYIDGYATLCALTGKSIPQASFTYDLAKNADTGYGEITFHCDDNVQIYCTTSSASALAVNSSKWSKGYFVDGDTLSFNYNATVNAVAYADDMAKSDDRIIAVSKPNGNGYLYTSSTSELRYCQYFDSKTVEVPSTYNGNPVTTLGSAAFAGNKSVETVILPESITSIGSYAFTNCPNLKKIIAPGVTSVGRYAFCNCESLMFAYLPNVSTVFNCSLSECEELTAVDIGSLSEETSLDITSTAFDSSNNIIDLNKTGHLYSFDSKSDNGTFTYKCTACSNNQKVDLSADILLEMWTPYIVGRTIDTTEYDSLFLFDVTGDGIINAKDYSVLNDFKI